MLWPPNAGSERWITNFGTVGTTQFGTGVPGNATTLLDGTVTELISAANNTQNSWGISVHVNNTGLSSTIAEAVLDILIGGATDDVLIDSLMCGYSRADAGAGYNYYFPVHIPAGVRIAGRFASVRTAITAAVGVVLYGGGVPPHRVGRKVTTLGTMVNNCRGVNLTIAASGAAATATQIIASTAEDYFAVIPGFQTENDSGLSGDGYAAIGIGVGASTEERIGTWYFVKNSGEAMGGPFPARPIFRHIPSGTRMTILSSNAGSNETNQGGLIYAVS